MRLLVEISSFLGVQSALQEVGAAEKVFVVDNRVLFFWQSKPLFGKWAMVSTTPIVCNLEVCSTRRLILDPSICNSTKLSPLPLLPSAYFTGAHVQFIAWAYWAKKLNRNIETNIDFILISSIPSLLEILTTWCSIVEMYCANLVKMKQRRRVQGKRRGLSVGTVVLRAIRIVLTTMLGRMQKTSWDIGDPLNN